jgi:drug/metabolite transporter (DMT)-like permease
MSSRVIVFAVLALIIGNLFATFADVIVKYIAIESAVFQYIFIRQLIVVIIVTPFWLKLPKAERGIVLPKVYAFRACLTSIGAPATVLALLHLPLATANMIFYLAPFITLILGLIVFKEEIHTHRFAVVLLGFFGVFIALKPDYIGIEAGYALITAIAVACFNVSVKWLPKKNSTVVTLFWTNVFALPLLSIGAFIYWQPITTELLILCVSTCLCFIIYQACCIYAFQNADVGAVSVAEYSGLVFAIVLGWLVFKETIDMRTIIGACFILAPILWQSHYEYRLLRRV